VNAWLVSFRRLALALPLSLSMAGAGAAVAAPAHGGGGGGSFAGVTLGRITFYSQYDYANCRPLGAPSRVFPSGESTVYVDIRWPSWRGTHNETENFYYPGGRFDTYYSGRYNDNGATSSCIRFHPHGRLGIWRLDVVIDGHYLGSAYFTVVPGAAPSVGSQTASWKDPQTGVSATISYLRVDAKGDSSWRPNKGQEFVLFRAVLKNTSNSGRDYNPEDFHATVNGRRYDTCTGAGIPDSDGPGLSFGTIPAHGTEQGNVGCQVPLGTSRVQISWDDGSTLSNPHTITTFTVK
jgi:hypothetical protein